MNDFINRQKAINSVGWLFTVCDDNTTLEEYRDLMVEALKDLPAAQPDLPEAYAKAVWEWLLGYQIKAAELKAKYSAYEVLSWVVNDWRRGHGGLN